MFIHHIILPDLQTPNNFVKTENKRMLSKSFYKAIAILILKADKDNKKENYRLDYRSVSLMNKDMKKKNPNKYL